VAKKAVNCFEDYFEIYDAEQVKTIVKENIKDLNLELFEEIGIDDGAEKQFINIKCSNCYNPVGVKDSLYKYYIFFNAI
jgi:predicted nucleic-acid-binding Zn-ribbon protein